MPGSGQEELVCSRFSWCELSRWVRSMVPADGERCLQVPQHHRVADVLLRPWSQGLSAAGWVVEVWM